MKNWLLILAAIGISTTIAIAKDTVVIKLEDHPMDKREWTEWCIGEALENTDAETQALVEGNTSTDEVMILEFDHPMDKREWTEWCIGVDLDNIDAETQALVDDNTSTDSAGDSFTQL